MTSLPSFLAASTTACQSSACAGITNPASQTSNAALSVFLIPSPLLFSRPGRAWPLDFDHDILLFDRDRECLGPERIIGERSALFDFQLIAPHLGAVGLA